MKKSLPSLIAGHLVTDIYMAVIPAMVPLLILENGYTYLMAGLLVTTFNLSSSFTQPIMGWLSDTKGLSINLSISLLISAVCVSLMGFASRYELLIVLAAAGALGHAFFHPAALSRVSEMCSAENRGIITSLFVVGGNIGLSCGPVITGALLTAYGLPGVGLLVIPALIVAPMLAAIHTSQKIPRMRRDTTKAPALTRASLTPLALLITASTFRAWSIFAAITFIPTFLVEMGYGLARANLLLTLMLLAGVCGQAAGGWISDRYGRKEFCIASLAVALPSFMLFFLVQGVASLCALMVFGFALWSTFSVALSISHEMMPGRIGVTSGLMIGFTMGMGGIGAAVNGLIADTCSLTAAIGTIPIPIIIALILFALLPYPWKEKRLRRDGTGS